MSIYLTEANRILSMLKDSIASANKLATDRQFISCLSEEISAVIKDDASYRAVFVIAESGDVNFSKIEERVGEVTMPYVSIDIDLYEKRAKLAEANLDIELKLKKKELMDRLLKVNS
jgi:hypothetical protein